MRIISNCALFPESNVDIEALDIPVNAVATALKDFFSKHLPPLFDDKLTTELEDIAGEWRSRMNAKGGIITH